MRLVRADLLKKVVESVRVATEWPHYAIFVHIVAFDSVAITPRAYLHGDLFVMLKEEWTHHSNLDVRLRDADIFDGHIEWEDDGTHRILTERGERLPPEIESQLLGFLGVGNSGWRNE